MGEYKIEYESKYLDIDYLERRLQTMPEITSGKLVYQIKKSDRPNSNSIYIRFGNFIRENYFIGCGKELRISDHPIENGKTFEFIVKPNRILTKGRKQHFRELMQGAINLAYKRIKYKSIDLLTKEKKDEQSSING